MVSPMGPWLLVLLAAAPGPEVLDAAELDAPAVLLVRSPPALAGDAGRAVDALAAWLRARTDLDVRSAEQSGMDPAVIAACPAETLFRCVVERVAAARARWAFLLSVLPGGAGRASATLLALDSREVRPTDDEDAIYGRAAVLRIDDLRAPLATLLDEGLAAALDRAGRLDPLGEIAVTVGGEAGPWAVELDDRLLGTASGAPVTIGRVRPGARRLVVMSRAGRAATTVSVIARGRVQVDLQLASAAAEPRYAVWAGAALLALGSGAAVAGAVASASASPTVCLRPGDVGCDDAAPLGPPTGVVEARSPWLALGVGSALLGAVWLTSGAVDEDGGWAPWGLALGAGLGAAAAAITVAL
jgi:hypothetical protein